MNPHAYSSGVLCRERMIFPHGEQVAFAKPCSLAVGFLPGNQVDRRQRVNAVAMVLSRR